MRRIYLPFSRCANHARQHDMTTGNNHTHTAYAFQRNGRKSGRLLEVGPARIDRECDVVHLFMNRQPIGGYTGYVVLYPIGQQPPSVAVDESADAEGQ
jgi:hypothetical protein